MMKRFSLSLVLLAGVAISACKKDKDEPVTPVANTVDFVAVINNEQQVPANTSAATGEFTATLNRDTKKLTYKVTFTGLATALTTGHIHLGAPGRKGASFVNFTIPPATSPINGEATVTDAFITAMLKGQTYVNLHTVAFPGGEIRGNVRPKSTEFMATINAAQQVPTNTSTATGAFTGTYDATTKKLTYNVTFAGMMPTAGHVHIGAPGKNGPPAVNFDLVATSPITGNAVLTQATADSLFAGSTYVNLHTAAFAGGEIRGNITTK